MPNKQRLELKQAQSLVMTPQLQQSIKLLQFSSIELSIYINQELEKNPLLTREDASEEEPGVSYEDSDRQSPPEKEMPETVTGQGRDEGFEENYKESWDTAEYRADLSNLTYTHSKNGEHSNNSKPYPFDELQTSPLTLKTHISEQVSIQISDHRERMIAAHLTDLLDDNGYIAIDLEPLAALFECNIAIVEQVLYQLQSFDPPGVFARSVAECLALQLKDTNRLTPDMQLLLNHLDLLAQGELKTLQKLCNQDEAGLKAMIKEIKSLNPKPGTNFSADLVQAVQPDVYLRKDAGGKWLVALNQEVLPKLLINNQYIQEIGGKIHKKEEKKYLAEQTNAASWLVKVLNQRAETILKVATEITIQQQEFFDKGIRFLKPLTLTGIAEAVGMHESTISRVTTHKYMATPLGMYELKYFFSSSIQGSEGGGEYSSRSVKFFIQELIGNETPGNVLSDEDIALQLKAKGMDIARRTVAKYREDLGIPTSAQRKRGKRIEDS